MRWGDAVKIELWQVPLLVIVAIVVVEYAAYMLLRRLSLSVGRIAGASVLAVMGVILFTLFVFAWPPVGTSAVADLIDILAGIGSLWLGILAYRQAAMTYQEVKQAKDRPPPDEAP